MPIFDLTMILYGCLAFGGVVYGIVWVVEFVRRRWRRTWPKHRGRR